MSMLRCQTGFKAGIIILTGFLLVGCNPQPKWPQVENEHKPWTRWWWMGSAVNQEDLTKRMEEYKEANLGGVEITPIYGVAGYEDQFIDYLSPAWMEMLVHTLEEGDRLNLGIDMATGTGWPFGGPWIHEEQASKRLYYKKYEADGGQTFDEEISYTQQPFLRSVGNTIYELHGFLKAEGEDPQGTMDQPLRNPESDPLTISDIKQPLSANENLQELALEQVRFEKQLPLAALVAYSEDNRVIDLTGQLDDNNNISWEAPDGSWTLYAVFTGAHGKTVERAAPGGEGFVIDHFSTEPLQHYLSVFDTAFAGHDLSSLRSFFNDSYEVDDAEGEANWTPDFFAQFEEKRGYDLREHLPALLEEQDYEIGHRLLSDYRETVSDLLLERFTREWDQWAEGKSAMIRNQAHGSPANILDLYAASDIPETEGTDIIRAKMASSAANVTGKRLISSESATWLNEHFISSLSDVKKAVDRYFISGVNHIFYHGTAYSPDGDRWPGWLFYAAVHFNERNPFWEHFGDFNNYVTRVQSFLQSGTHDNDILLYYPIHDQWSEPGNGLLLHFDGGLDERLEGTALKDAAERMVEAGYAFDFISDRQLMDVVHNAGRLETGGNSYQTILVPQSRFIPLETLEKLVALAREGATIVTYRGLPGGVPGLSDLESQQQRFKQITGELNFSKVSGTGSGEILEASTGAGRFITGNSLTGLLDYAGISRESMTDDGLLFARRSYDEGKIYFITNWSNETVDGWVPLASEFTSAAVFDPMQEKAGYALVRDRNGNNKEIYLQLAPGESSIVRTYESERIKPSYRYAEQAGEAQPIEGEWTLEFLNGGPKRPDAITTDSLSFWTEFDGEAFKSFSGTARYSITFDKPAETSDGLLLDLGEVRESASVFLNGEKLGTLIGPRYEIYIEPEFIGERNELVIEVSNLMANRIAWLERQEVNWKKFYNVNFPARLGENRNRRGLFDASAWKPFPSGLAGPVTIVPARLVQSRE